MKTFLYIAKLFATLFRRPFLVVMFPLGEDATEFKYVVNARGIERLNKEIAKGLDGETHPVSKAMTVDDRVVSFLDRFDIRDSAKIVYERIGLPYLSARFVCEGESDPAFDIAMNRHAIYDIDQRYIDSKRNDYDLAYDNTLKVRMFVADIIASSVPSYSEERVPLSELPADELIETLDELGGRVPSIREKPVRDVADIAMAQRATASEGF